MPGAMPDATTNPPLTIQGRMLHATAPHELELLEDAVLAVDADGAIAALHAPGTQAHRAAREAAGDELLVLRPGQILLPGLVDLHVHAPQWKQAGRALDRPLQQWLLDCTFPLEARFADLDFAIPVYDDLVGCLLANGTTTSVYFATIHEAASLALARICLARGQRAFVGRIAMDDPELCPAGYRDASAQESVAATRRFIADLRAMPGNERALVRPMVTPRFIPSCTDAALAGLGALAAECGCAVQTHCSESDWAHGAVLQRVGCTDAASLDGFGLLRRGSILAHGNFLCEDDMRLIAARGAAIAHCPISNAFFAGAVFSLRQAIECDVHVGLGTDISGGYSPSILDNARQAVIASRLLETGTDATRPAALRGSGKRARIGFREAFWLATGGGGQALDLPIGQFRPQYRFDAILLDGTHAGSDLRLATEDTADDLVQKLICHATRADLSRIWVEGRLVHANGAP